MYLVLPLLLPIDSQYSSTKRKVKTSSLRRKTEGPPGQPFTWKTPMQAGCSFIAASVGPSEWKFLSEKKVEDMELPFLSIQRMVWNGPTAQNHLGNLSLVSRMVVFSTTEQLLSSITRSQSIPQENKTTPNDRVVP